MIKKAMKKMQHSCTRLNELLQVEVPGILAEIERHKYFLTKKNGHVPTEQEAERYYFEHYGHTWATGFKYAYCNYVCSARETCAVKEEGIKGGKK